MFTDVAYAAPAVADLYPGRVIGPDSDDDKIRVILTETLLVIYGEQDIGGGMRRVATLRKVPVTAMYPDPDISEGWVATDDTGAEWRIRKGSGCGCGSPLRFMPSPPPVDL